MACCNFDLSIDDESITVDTDLYFSWLVWSSVDIGIVNRMHGLLQWKASKVALGVVICGES
jgi:hypothetical protein